MDKSQHKPNEDVEKRGPGRPKGSKNKAPTINELRKMIYKAVVELGGSSWLVAYGRDNPEHLIRALVSLMPKQADEDDIKILKGTTTLDFGD